MIVKHMPIGAETGHTAGRRLLKKMYKEETGCEMPEILLGERGKPYFAEGAYHFSIAHTKHLAFCVLSKTPVGIDAEALDREVNPALAEKILSPYEYAQYEKAEDKRKALLTFWVLKEAAGKLSGEGINGYPNHTNFDLSDLRVQTIDNHLVAIIE
jgi:phosphopantetheinyl transferase